VPRFDHRAELVGAVHGSVVLVFVVCQIASCTCKRADIPAGSDVRVCCSGRQAVPEWLTAAMGKRVWG